MVESLEGKIKQAERERIQKYPLLDITNNRKEIREISELACEYARELNPSMKPIKTWEIAPRITMEFINQTYSYLASKTSSDNGEVSVELGNILTMSIEFTYIANADKDGTFNPRITVGSDLVFDTDKQASSSCEETALDDSEETLYLLPEFYKNREEIQTIAQNTMLVLAKDYELTISNWSYVVLIFVAFMRKAKDYVVLHKDDTEFGIDIDLGDVIGIGIEKYGDDEEVGYCFYIKPKRSEKMGSKDDNKSELH